MIKKERIKRGEMRVKARRKKRRRKKIYRL